MRTKVAAITVALAMLGLAGSAQAVSTSMVWQSSGTATLVATATGAQTLDLFISIATGETVTGYQVSVDLGGTTFSAGVCASPAAFNVPCPGGQPIADPFGNLGFAGSWSGATLFTNVPGPFSGQIGTLTVNVTGGATLEIGTVTNQDAVTLLGGTVVPATSGFASVSIIPEPGTIALMGLGLGALAFVGRRR